TPTANPRFPKGENFGGWSTHGAGPYVGTESPPRQCWRAVRLPFVLPFSCINKLAAARIIAAAWKRLGLHCRDLRSLAQIHLAPPGQYRNNRSRIGKAGRNGLR